MKRTGCILVWILVGVVVAPVLLTPLFGRERRSFEWVRLADTNYREVEFRNTEQGLDLAGMLFVPEGQGPFPAVVIIQGSGTSVRDNGWYLTLTQYLQDQGVLVLLPDKRGSEKSGGDWRTASYEDLATDTVAAVDYLRRQEQVEVAGVGVIGMSQGGRIAPIVANTRLDLAFVVNVVGGALPAHEALVYEETHNLREMGIPPGVSDGLARASAWSLIHVRQKEHWDAVGNFDPVAYWRGVEVPALVLYGEDDTNVDSTRSAERLNALGKPNIEVKVYPESGHALESPQGQGDSIFRPDAMVAIVDFIYAHSGAS